MTRIASAHSIKQSLKPGRKRSGFIMPDKPQEGSQIRALYDALHATARDRAYVPAVSPSDLRRMRIYVRTLCDFYAMDIAPVLGPNLAGTHTIKGRKLKSHTIIGYRLISEVIHGTLVRF